MGGEGRGRVVVLGRWVLMLAVDLVLVMLVLEVMVVAKVVLLCQWFCSGRKNHSAA